MGEEVSELRNKPMLSFEQVLELMSREKYEDLKLKFLRTFGISYKY